MNTDDLIQRQQRELQQQRLRDKYQIVPGMPADEIDRRRQQLMREEGDLEKKWRDTDLASDMAKNKAEQKANEDRFQARMDDVTRRSQENARNQRIANEGGK